MTRNLIAVVAGGALAFALAGAASPAMAWGSTHPAHPRIWAPADPPVVRDSAGHGPTIPPDPW